LPEPPILHYGLEVKSYQQDATAVSDIATAIGQPGRAAILFCLLDGRARTSTELAAVAEVSASTTSAHLQQLLVARLLKVMRQGKHRYYCLSGSDVANVLEELSVLAGGAGHAFVPTTPPHLRAARTCYDHMAGTVSVALHDHFVAMGWLLDSGVAEACSYDISPAGTRAFCELGIDVEATRSLRRRFACGCLDWSERRLHLGGALGGAFLELALRSQWLTRDLDSRGLRMTRLGRRVMLSRFGVHAESL
jgi:DNA-binding transcriptional ArsR family regulator